MLAIFFTCFRSIPYQGNQCCPYINITPLWTYMKVLESWKLHQRPFCRCSTSSKWSDRVWLFCWQNKIEGIRRNYWTADEKNYIAMTIITYSHLLRRLLVRIAILAAIQSQNKKFRTSIISLHLPTPCWSCRSRYTTRTSKRL